MYLAVHRVLQTPRAVKVLLPEWTRHPRVVARFIDEARAAAAIHHRNIIGVHDCGRLPSGEWYILLDYCEGGTLTRFLESQGGPLALHDIVHILAEVANGLGAAHDRGIIHRDLKPDNIYLSRRDGDPHHVTILDFGVAKLSEPLESFGLAPSPRPRAAAHRPAPHRDAAVSTPGTFVGTPAYMAPEQLRGDPVGPGVDVFALGVIAYQLFTGGALPFQREPTPREAQRVSPVELYRRITQEGPVDPRLRAERPAERSWSPEHEAWWKILRSALAAAPGDRPDSPRALALALAAATAGDGFTPSGLALVRTYARELLAARQVDDTVRAPSPVAAAGRARYEIVRRIGAGGMAEVFEAKVRGALGFARTVAIKRVRPDLSSRPAFSSAFIEEARLTSQLDHPNVVSVLDFDRDEHGLFLVMEYVPGADLATLLRAGALPRSTSIFLVSEVLRGLAYAHAPPPRGDGPAHGGVIHRDLSPHNVLLSREGAVKISDFGIARALQGRTSVQVSSLSGTPAYMSPEQVRMDPLDVRSDLFAAGVLLWECLFGTRPFLGTTKEVLAQVRFREIASPAPGRPGLPTDLARVLQKLLAREPARRFSCANEALEALLACEDAPRDGRTELSLLLAERLRANGEPRAQSTPGGTSSERGASTAASGAAPELGPALSQRAASARAAPTGVRRRRVLGLAALALVIALTARGLAGKDLPAPATARARAPRGLAGRDGGAGSSADRPEPPGQPPARLVPGSAAPVTPAEAAAPVTLAQAATPAGPGAPPRDAPQREPAAGVLIVAVRPWATVWVNGRRYGETPVHIRLPAGKHRVRLQNQRASQTLTVAVSPARATLLETEL